MILMKEQEKKEFLRRVNNAKEQNIFVEDDINIDNQVRGIYCFFAKKDEEEIPFYVGKSNNIFFRMFNGHVYHYLRGVRSTDVQKHMEEYLKEDYEVEVRILRRIDYIGDGFIQDANRLALAELEEIVKMQNKGYCITDDQISESVKRRSEKQAWEDLFGNSTITG